MTEQNGREGDLEAAVAAQVDYIKSSFDEAGTPVGHVPEGRGVGYLYAEGQFLVREERLADVRAALMRQLMQPDDPSLVEPVVPGVVLLHLTQTPAGEQPMVFDALEQVDAAVGPGNAFPDHVLTVAGTGGGPEVGPCPATEPEEVYDMTEPFPGVCGGNSGAGVLVYVADTGLLADAAATHPWLNGVDGDPDPLPSPEPDGTQPIPPYTGHGTFVAGVLRCLAPRADVFVANAFDIAGSTLESDLVRRLTAALGLGVDIFHLSITAPTRNNQPMIAIEAWLRLLRQYKGVVCVVAAGNNGSRRRCWPAASEGTVSVGALAADWRTRARFSNFGSWVDVYAPGRNLVNAYATGSYTCRVPPYTNQVRTFYGMARWSGTSFSTPVVTGLIADRMSRTGENGQQAAAALLAEARSHAIEGVGPVLLPVSDRTQAPPIDRSP